MKNLESQALGKYELVRTIGEGSMGTVYLAHDSFSRQEVAIKVAHAYEGDDPRLARRRRKLFFNEAKMAGMLRHPNILTTLDAGIEDEYRYLVMEYIAGAQTLDKFCDSSDLLPADQVVGILLRSAIALDYAHEHGVIHRDVKPRNILLTQDNEVKVADFGIALIARDDVDETQVMGRLGSPRYMSPEQIRDEGITPQSDVFSLGVVAYEMLTGVHPFESRTIAQIARLISREPHTPVRHLNPALPAQLAHIVDRCLKKHPAGRYRTAMDLAGDLSLIYDAIKHAERFSPGSDLAHRIRSLRFFEGFEEAEIAEVAQAGVLRHYGPGEQILVEGASGDTFYVLLSGQAAVRRGEAEVAVVEPGASFGEMGFLMRGRRTATIVAIGPVTALEVRASLVARVSIGCQLRFHKAFLRAMAERLHSVMEYVGRTDEQDTQV